MIPTPLLTLTPDGNLASGIAYECEVASYRLRRGRDDPTGQPEAGAITLDVVSPLPGAVEIGWWVHVRCRLGATVYPRFVGKITDLQIAWETLDAVRPRIIAAGHLASMGRCTIGDVPYPQESDGVRANRGITSSGVPTDAARTDLGTVQVLTRDVDAQPALSVSHDAAEDGGGILWEAADGAVLYADADHRRGTVAALVIDACAVPLTLSWLKNTEGMCNDIRVRYGVPPSGGEQPEYHEVNQPSRDRYGTFSASVTTRLATLADAQDRARAILARAGEPVWVLDGIDVDLGRVGKNDGDGGLSATAAMLGLDMHSLVQVTAMPLGAPYPSATLWVEGLEERVHWGSHVLSLHISGYCRTSPEPRWDDVPSDYTWDTYPDVTWDQSTCIGPLPPSGKWDDVPGTTQWDAVAASVTWDSWT